MAVRAQAKSARRLGFDPPVPPPVRSHVATLCRLACSTASGTLVTVSTCIGCLGRPTVTLLFLYSTRCTATARIRTRATLAGKQGLVVTALCTVIALGTWVGFALPPTPEPIKSDRTRLKPGGFLQGPFQVIVPYLSPNLS